MIKKMKNKTYTGTRETESSKRELEHRRVARKVAEEGIVLLENKTKVLPLKEGRAISLYGRGASQTIKGGTGSGDVNEREVVTIYDGMKNAGFVISNTAWIAEYNERYAEAKQEWKRGIVDEVGESDAMTFFECYTQTPFFPPSEKKVEDAESEIAMYVLSRVAGEAADRKNIGGDYLISDNEKEMLEVLSLKYSEIILVINTGGVMDLSFVDEISNINTILQIMQPGMEGGNAVANVVLGKVSPSAHLVDTWAFNYEDYPNSETFSHCNGNVEKEVYEEGIYVGYRYFDSFNIKSRYGFGYGLSYTDFNIKYINAEWRQLKAEIEVTALIENVGDTYAGKEVLQVYASLPVGNLPKEYRRLVGFAKTKNLMPNEVQEITVKIPLDNLASFDKEKAMFLLEKGYYGIWIGNDLENSVMEVMVKIEEDIIIKTVDNISPLQQKIKEIQLSSDKVLKRYNHDVETFIASNKKVLDVVIDSKETLAVTTLNKKDNFFEEAEKLVDSLTKEELIKLVSGDPNKGMNGDLGAAGTMVPGSAGETNDCAVDKNITSIVLADGPAGLRLMRFYNVHEDAIISMPFKFSVEGGGFCDNLDTLPGERYYQYCTAIPVGTMLAQTWNPELLESVGEMVGREMEEFNVTLWLAPGMNIHRNPLCGRNFEYFSEDPLLTGIAAAAITKGVQNIPGCGTTIKHFVCNNQEDNRMNSDSVISERALREIYLRGFEIAIKSAQPMSIMTSYNKINGIHAANNYDLCTKVAREEWGFAGLIMTDWTTTRANPLCTASGCLKAGNDLIMPGEQSDADDIISALESGKLSLEELKACVTRIVSIILKSNQYEDSIQYNEYFTN